jgi:hypothetical protein
MGTSGRQTWITLASRRGAGVWSHLPSISTNVLAQPGGIRTALWVDLGLRYEMLNHLGIPPTRVGAAQCLSGVVAEKERTGQFGDVDPLELGTATLGADDGSTGPLCTRMGTGLDPYLAEVRLWRDIAARIYMLPFHVPAAPVTSLVSDIHLRQYASAIEHTAHAVGADLVFLTCEGQPEARMFENELSRHMLLRWALDKASIIVSLVRHDSLARFQDGIAIPTILSRYPDWRSKLALVLTRSAEPIDTAPAELRAFVLGRLPFSQFIAHAASLGRVPLFDRDNWAGDEHSSSEVQEYTLAVQNVARALANRAIEQRAVTPESGSPEELAP